MDTDADAVTDDEHRPTRESPEYARAPAATPRPPRAAVARRRSPGLPRGCGRVVGLARGTFGGQRRCVHGGSLSPPRPRPAHPANPAPRHAPEAAALPVAGPSLVGTARRAAARCRVLPQEHQQRQQHQRQHQRQRRPQLREPQPWPPPRGGTRRAPTRGGHRRRSAASGRRCRGARASRPADVVSPLGVGHGGVTVTVGRDGVARRKPRTRGGGRRERAESG